MRSIRPWGVSPRPGSGIGPLRFPNSLGGVKIRPPYFANACARDRARPAPHRTAPIVDRRLLTFTLASTAFFLTYFVLRLNFAPPPLPADRIAADNPAVVDDDQTGTQEEAQTLETIDQASAANAGIEPVGEGQTPAVDRPTTPQWVTLGSMDPASGHFLLVTLNSRGGGVERVELTERNAQGRLKYRRVDVRSGYLGYLGADPAATDTGVAVNVVGPGTPAALAKCQVPGVETGLRPGDTIVSVGGQTVFNATDLHEALVKTEPGDRIELSVLRGDDERNLTFDVELTEHPLDMIRLAEAGGEDQVAGNLSRLSCLMTLSKVGRRAIVTDERSLEGMADPSTLVWNVADALSIDAAAFELELSDAEINPLGGGALTLARTYAISPGSYVIDMDVSIRNGAGKDQQIAYRLEGANGITLEGWWYSNKISPNWGGSAARDLIYRTTAEGHELISGFALYKQASKQGQDADKTLFAPDSSVAARDLKYIGVDAQYFTAAYIPPEGETSLAGFGRATASLVCDAQLINYDQAQAVNTSFFLDSDVVSLAAGESYDRSLRLFAGPKSPELMAGYDLSDCVYYGWFSFVAQPMGSLLHFLSGLGNWTVAIILLTVLVRGCMFPLSRKAAINAQRMQELAPQMKAIGEKHKDDMEARMKAQQELYKRVGFNPLAGCAPMFLQLPIFMGLYRCLSVDIELRQAAFASWTSWASNLAAPDMLSYWGDWMPEYFSGRGTGWLGPYFNVLPMIVVVLFLVQQKLFMPPATDEQTRLTQKMMNFMTLFMGLFFFRVPAGLCVYFITSSLWGIGERVLVKKTLPSTPHFDSKVLTGDGAVIEGKATPSRDRGKPDRRAVPAAEREPKNETWADRLRKKLAEEAAKANNAPSKPREAPAPTTLPRDRKRPKRKK